MSGCDSILTAGRLQTILRKLLTYCVLRPTQPPTLFGTKWVIAYGLRPIVTDWGGGMSASCKLRIQLFVNAGNGWPHSAMRYQLLIPISCHFRDCQSAFSHEFVLCTKRYSKYWTLPVLDSSIWFFPAAILVNSAFYPLEW